MSGVLCNYPMSEGDVRGLQAVARCGECGRPYCLSHAAGTMYGPSTMQCLGCIQAAYERSKAKERAYERRLTDAKEQISPSDKYETGVTAAGDIVTMSGGSDCSKVYNLERPSAGTYEAIAQALENHLAQPIPEPAPPPPAATRHPRRWRGLFKKS